MIEKLMLGGNIFSYALDLKESSILLDQAHDLGIRSVDTANVYSNGDSERIIGACLKRSRKDWFIATKNGLNTNQEPAGLNSRKKIFENLNKSLDRLETDYIDLYQLHNYDPEVSLDVSLGALEELKIEGKILNYGVSNFKPEHFGDSLKEYRIFSNQIHFNIINREAELLYKDVLSSSNLKLMAYNVLARGLFKEGFLKKKKYQSFRHSKSNSVSEDMNEGMIDILRILKKFSDSYNISVANLAIRFVIEKPWINYAVVGIRTEAQLTEIHDDLIKDKKINWAPLFNDLSKFSNGSSLNLGSYNFYSNN